MCSSFLLHSCGSIFAVMDDLIDSAGIDAKHSNEDSIAPFSVWIERYGERIGNFAGVDADVLCQSSPDEIAEYVGRIFAMRDETRGLAIGSGNSIPDYIPIAGYTPMVDTVRTLRGD